MNDTINTRKQELQSHIEDLEESLAELKVKLRKIEEDEQHAAIDNLEVYLEAVDNKYDNLRNFWSTVGDELRDLFGGLKNDKDDKRGQS